MKEIAIFSAGLPHGPRTLEIKSLGGSETAALMVAKELRKLGHLVTLYCQLPAAGEPDHVPSGTVADDGVRYIAIEEYANRICSDHVDLLIVSRVPQALALPHQAKRAVLWLHDLATHGPFVEQLNQVIWNFDEIWTVSEFHRKQTNEVTGYPLDHIVAMRNGIIPVESELGELAVELERDPKLLYYGNRPERGLEFLVRPGGVMERLPEYRLQFSAYGDFTRLPEHVQALYKRLFDWARRLPNVEFLGSLTQAQVRDKLHECAALVYPSDFEETSCILAREAIEASCPIVACAVGALPETVGRCGAMTAPRRAFSSDDDFCETFTAFLRATLEDEEVLNDMAAECAKRQDLYWGPVAQMMAFQGLQMPSATVYSRARALIDVGDVIPAKALLETVELEEGSAEEWLTEQIHSLYPWLLCENREAQARMLTRHYDTWYKDKPPVYGDLAQQPRFCETVRRIEALNLPAGASIVDWGCCEGNQVINLAARFPQYKFFGYDHSRSCLDHARAMCEKAGLQNLVLAAEGQWKNADLVLLTEVLEHTVRPWEVVDEVEWTVKAGGTIIATTPIGPWEAQRIFKDKEEYRRREHLWHLDKDAMRIMLEKKADLQMTVVAFQVAPDMQLLGNLVTQWRVDRRRKTRELDPLTKALLTAPRREVIGAAIIAANAEKDILRMLTSVAERGVRDFSIALGPCRDQTASAISRFEYEHPWCRVLVHDVPAIEPNKFGFDDARNASAEPFADGKAVDWILWIDCDEELVGGTLERYARPNAYQSYAIHQHHMTCDPRGAPPQIDRPARLFRTRAGFRFYGKIHEHAELGVNGGPGYALLLPDVDIMHIGYKNEAVRRDRFARNLPFLSWDRQVNPDRHLGKYLWLRDLIHQMRYCQQNGDIDGARRFAQEAVQFYDAHWEDMLHFGNGMVQGFEYVSQARQFLGLGAPVKSQVALADGRVLTLQGVITKPDELTRLINHSLKHECELARSRYH